MSTKALLGLFPADRLQGRIIAIQLVVHTMTFLLTLAFASRVLLLEPAASSAAIVIILVVGLLVMGCSSALTFFAMRPYKETLRAIAEGAARIDAADVLAIYGLPARLAAAGAGFAVVWSSATLVPALRSQAIDEYTDLALVLLLLTMASTASLLSYVAMRASVARVLESAPPRVTQQALRQLGRGALGRLRRRFLAAVAAPVAFVALGASLLVDAHARAYDRESRAGDAKALAEVIYEPIEGVTEDTRNHGGAVEAAAALGFRLQQDPDLKADDVDVQHGEEGETQVTVPVTGVPGAALVRFGTTRFEPIVAVYALLALIAVALAAILGTRIGVAFEWDVALATREIRRAGVAEVMRGTIILHEARFTTIHALLQAIDSLGGIFRQFASAQKSAIEAREATERMRGLLLASMSHDLKAPLNAVLGFAELVGRGQLTGGQRESLAIIEQRGRELLLLIDTILDSARVEAGELEVAPQPTRMNDVVMSSVLEARDLAVGTDVQIKGEVQPDMPTVFVDPTRVVQALTAVVMTAVRFSHKGVVPVRAMVGGRGERLRVEVETSGEGLPLAEREKIFDAFKSAESARRHGALGLGLQLARSIVEIHGGTIEVDNTDGGGMVFRVGLPIANDRASIRARASKPVFPGSM